MKGFLDRTLAFLVMICFWWVYLIIAVLIKIEDPKGPVIFKQERLGKRGEVYWMYKFRSMTVGAEQQEGGVFCVKGDKRVTKIGRFIRATSIDELPQFINILKGDMSLIGPRPLVPEYLWVFDDYQNRRHEVRPGITGWAQVNGRNLCKLSKKFEYDVWYVDNCNLKTDIIILFKTIINVIKRDSIGSGGGDMKDIDDLNMQERIDAIMKEKGLL